MAAFTEPQKAEIRMYLGWSARFFQFDVALEQAMNSLSDPLKADTVALFTNAIGGSPPGFLATLNAIDAERVLARERLKATKVGSIDLNNREMEQLAKEAKRTVARMARTLGVEVVWDIYSGRLPPLRASRGGNYLAHG